MKTVPYPDVSYLTQLAKRAGDVMRRNFRLGMPRECKEDDSPVTETDLAINQFVVDSVSRDFPHIQVIGEEGSYELDGAEYTVLCDPVDGTIPFCHGIPISTFVVAVVREHQPLAAVIYDPFWGRMWHATQNRGSFLNNKPVRVSGHGTLHRSNICVFGWRGERFNPHVTRQKLIDAGAIVGNPFTVAYFGGLLASGEWEAIIFPGQHGWETAAMQLIIEEAGGRATDIHGRPLRYGPRGEINGHIVSNGLIHDELVEIVASCQTRETGGN